MNTKWKDLNTFLSNTNTYSTLKICKRHIYSALGNGVEY